MPKKKISLKVITNYPILRTIAKGCKSYEEKRCWLDKYIGCRFERSTEKLESTDKR